MREIKFRAWDGENGMYPVTILHFNKDGIHAPYVTEVMQYTGLKDKNGKEIYEGDLLQIGPQIQTVVWDDKGAHGWVLDTPHFSLGGSQSIFYEVIGNIYENPNILENDKS